MNGNGTFAGSVNPPEVGTVIPVKLGGMGGQPDVFINRIDVSGQSFTVDVATFIIEAMEFGDEEEYTESGGIPNAWTFEWRGVPWAFNTSALITPAGDFQVFGGEC